MNKIFLVFLVLFAILEFFHVSALKCHVCSTQVNSTCGDPFETDEFLVECPDAPEHVYKITHKKDAVNCRKLIQTIGGKHPLKVVFRSCGYLLNYEPMRFNNSCFKDAFSSFTSSYYCNCLGNECNTSDMIQMSKGLQIVVLIIAVFNAKYL